MYVMSSYNCTFIMLQTLKRNQYTLISYNDVGYNNDIWFICQYYGFIGNHNNKNTYVSTIKYCTSDIRRMSKICINKFLYSNQYKISFNNKNKKKKKKNK